MATILEKLQELKDEFDRRKKQIDELFTSVQKTMNIANEIGEEAKEAVEQIQQTIIRINDGMTTLSNDYKSMKEEMKKLKDNFWLKLFGVV